MQLNITPGPLALFVLVASITPGPNNLLLMRSGARFGVRRSLGHVAGVQIGFVGLLLLAHLGVGALLLALPFAIGVLRWGCFAYLLWLALVILRDTRSQPAAAMQPSAAAPARPMGFVQVLAFQLINPKAWMSAVTVVSAFYGSVAPSWPDLAIAAAISLALGSPCTLVWTIWGAAIDRVLTRPRARQIFGYCMAALVVATAIWMLR